MSNGLFNISFLLWSDVILTDVSVNTSYHQSLDLDVMRKECLPLPLRKEVSAPLQNSFANGL